MGVYTELSQREISDLVDVFGIQGVSTVEPTKDGMWQTTYIVRSTSRDVVVSIFEHRNIEEVLKLKELLLHLGTHSFPAPRIIEASDESLPHVEGRPVLVTEYMEGATAKYFSSNKLFQVGTALATLHTINPLDSLQNGSSLYPDTSSLMFNVTDHPYALWFVQNSSYFEEALPATLQKGIAHMDLWPDNVIFQKEDLQGFIDFERACLGYCLYDLGMTIMALCRVEERVDTSQIKALIKGYESVRNLTTLERSSLKLFTEYAAMSLATDRYACFNIRLGEPRNTMYVKALNIARDMHSTPNDLFMEEVFD